MLIYIGLGVFLIIPSTIDLEKWEVTLVYFFTGHLRGSVKLKAALYVCILY